jgi:hypothetical protein
VQRAQVGAHLRAEGEARCGIGGQRVADRLQRAARDLAHGQLRAGRDALVLDGVEVALLAARVGVVVLERGREDAAAPRARALLDLLAPGVLLEHQQAARSQRSSVSAIGPSTSPRARAPAASAGRDLGRVEGVLHLLAGARVQCQRPESGVQAGSSMGVSIHCSVRVGSSPKRRADELLAQARVAPPR